MAEEGRGVVLRKRIGLAVGILAFAAIAFLDSGLNHVTGPDGAAYGRRPAYAAGTAVLMAVWWFTEAIPIHWTACVPILAYPLLGVYGKGPLRDGGLAARPFLDAYIFMFLGGMMIGAASEQWNLHRRVALHIMRKVGTSPRRLLLGVLVATAFVSLWISNTATAVMMMPIGMALLAQLETVAGGRKLWHFGSAVMLAVAYGSNIGGIGSKIGTGPNSIFCGWVNSNLWASPGVRYEISFPFYIALAIPYVVLFIPLAWAALWRVARKDDLGDVRAREVLDRELLALGPMSRPEKKVLAVFLSAATLWVFGGLIRPRVAPHVPAFWEGFAFREKHYEAWVAVAAGLAVVALGTLSFRKFLKIPWETLLLLGGGFAMASGIEGSGLSRWLGGHLQAVADLKPFWQIGLAALAGVGLSAVASNTATITVMLNVLPRSLPLPQLLSTLMATTIATSCDFMLPAGTPPNAIVFGSGYIRLPTMIRTGFLLDVAAVVLLTFYGFFYLRLLFA